MKLRIPALKLTVPLILLGFAATLSAVNLLYHVPAAEREAEEDSRRRLAQEMSRLQSTLEYLLLKGDLAAAQHEIAVLAHNHDVTHAVMSDDRNVVIAATRRAWLGQQVADVLPQFSELRYGIFRHRSALQVALEKCDVVTTVNRGYAYGLRHEVFHTRIMADHLQEHAPTVERGNGVVPIDPCNRRCRSLRG